MIKVNDISVPLTEQDIERYIQKAVIKRLRVKSEDIVSVKLSKKSVDARKKSDIHYLCSADVVLKRSLKQPLPKGVTEFKYREYIIPECKPLKNPPVIVGFGPAGMFAGLILAEAGLCPVILERGEAVDERRKTVEKFWNGGQLNQESNVQFGEGGAGTFSDGKLTTGIKDFRIKTIFEKFVEYDAPSEILYLAKPHIGTDKLRNVVKNIRQRIISLGGKVIFNAKFTGYELSDNKISAVRYENNGREVRLETENLILAIGHSARDVFEYLYKNNVAMGQKNFAVGVRIEHLQSEISRSMYGKASELLPPADYKLAVHLPNGKSVYSFCMCPGGKVVSACSEYEGLVTNGMSNFARDERNANSALLVGISPADFPDENPMTAIQFQRDIERKAFIAGGGNYSAPVNLVGDFLKHRVSENFGEVIPSYAPDTKFALPDEYLPEIMCESLRMGIVQFGKKISGFDCGDAVLTGVESRSSSPVVIKRNPLTLQSVSVKGMYPCGEGAGYAGGIVSAGVDGIKCAEKIIQSALQK